MYYFCSQCQKPNPSKLLARRPFINLYNGDRVEPLNRTRGGTQLSLRNHQRQSANAVPLPSNSHGSLYVFQLYYYYDSFTTHYLSGEEMKKQDSQFLLWPQEGDYITFPVF